ncbi:MAG TPA: dihydrodipicolinate synthase family protein [Planctomycetota bacterium]|jgi:dihydrodipicolinate synthase/N-acetylneuraminate lyase|nr:dihydrodipicolinate synthase family protein [Planctomycetota bacterium]
MRRLRGILVPTIVPFRGPDLSVDAPALLRHLSFLEGAGVDGLVVLGTNGEFHSLTLEEKRVALAAAAENRGRLLLAAGTGAASLSEAAAVAAEAARLSFDALLLCPPFYPRGLKQKGLVDFFRAVLDAGAPLPACLYHIPRFTGVAFDRPLLEALLSTGRIEGLKDSTGTVESLAAFRSEFPVLDLFAGSDSLVLEGRRRGVAGAVTGLANAFPELVARAWAAPLPEAEAAQATLTAVRALAEGKDLPALSKALLGLRGFARSPVRPPLTELTPEEVEECARRLRELGLLPEEAGRMLRTDPTPDPR